MDGARKPPLVLNQGVLMPPEVVESITTEPNILRVGVIAEVSVRPICLVSCRVEGLEDHNIQ